MKRIQILLLSTLLILVATASGQSTKSTAAASASPPQPAQPPTLAATVDREISAVEKQIVDVAEAMPEDKYNFSPESLNIPGSDYKGVRSFAVQLKHIAASNYFIWSLLTGDKLPEGLKDGDGPASLKSKAEIIQFLKDSFALGHRAAAGGPSFALFAKGGNHGPRRSASFVFHSPLVTSNLAPTIEISHHRRSGRSGQSSKARPNSFVMKILTSKPLGLKILQTLFADPAPSKPFRGMGGGG